MNTNLPSVVTLSSPSSPLPPSSSSSPHSTPSSSSFKISQSADPSPSCSSSSPSVSSSSSTLLSPRNDKGKRKTASYTQAQLFNFYSSPTPKDSQLEHNLTRAYQKDWDQWVQEHERDTQIQEASRNREYFFTSLRQFLQPLLYFSHPSTTLTPSSSTLSSSSTSDSRGTSISSLTSSISTTSTWTRSADGAKSDYISALLQSEALMWMAETLHSLLLNSSSFKRVSEMMSPYFEEKDFFTPQLVMRLAQHSPQDLLETVIDEEVMWKSFFGYSEVSRAGKKEERSDGSKRKRAAPMMNEVSSPSSYSSSPPSSSCSSSSRSSSSTSSASSTSSYSPSAFDKVPSTLPSQDDEDECGYVPRKKHKRVSLHSNYIHRIERWFGHIDTAGEMKFGAVAVKWYCLANRDRVWDMTEWRGSRDITPPVAIKQSQVFLQLDIVRTVINLLDDPGFWRSQAWKDCIQGGDILSIDHRFFAEYISLLSRRDIKLHSRLRAILCRSLDQRTLHVVLQTLLLSKNEKDILNLIGLCAKEVSFEVTKKQLRGRLGLTTMMGKEEEDINNKNAVFKENKNEGKIESSSAARCWRGEERKCFIDETEEEMLTHALEQLLVYHLRHRSLSEILFYNAICLHSRKVIRGVLELGKKERESFWNLFAHFPENLENQEAMRDDMSLHYASKLTTYRSKSKRQCIHFLANESFLIRVRLYYFLDNVGLVEKHSRKQLEHSYRREGVQFKSVKTGKLKSDGSSRRSDRGKQVWVGWVFKMEEDELKREIEQASMKIGNVEVDDNDVTLKTCHQEEASVDSRKRKRGDDSRSTISTDSEQKAKREKKEMEKKKKKKKEKKKKKKKRDLGELDLQSVSSLDALERLPLLLFVKPCLKNFQNIVFH